MSPRKWNNPSCCRPETDSSLLCFFLCVMYFTQFYTLCQVLAFTFTWCIHSASTSLVSLPDSFIRKVSHCWYNPQMEPHMDPDHQAQIRTNERFSSTELMPHSNSYSVRTLLLNVVCGVIKQQQKNFSDVWTSQGLIRNNNSHWHYKKGGHYSSHSPSHLPHFYLIYSGESTQGTIHGADL